MVDKRDDRHDDRRDTKAAREGSAVAPVGTIVFYTPGKDEPTATENAAGLPAIVVATQESGTMTLVVFDSDGKVLPRRGVSVPVLDENGKPPLVGPYVMPGLKDITPPEPVAPTLASLDPAHAILGGEDVEMSCVGTGFKTTSVIMFAGQPEPIRYYSPESISTIVKPSLGWGAVAVPVTVKTDELESAPLEFTFEEAEAPAPEAEAESDVEIRSAGGGLVERKPRANIAEAEARGAKEPESKVAVVVDPKHKR